MTHLALAVLFCALVPAQDTYRKPPKEILDVLDAPAPPQASLNPARTHLLLMTFRRYPPIAELAQPMLRLAGARINPRNNAPHTSLRTTTGMYLVRIEDGKQMPVMLPKDARAGAPHWSPDGKLFAFTNTTAGTVDLYIGETATGRIRAIPNLKASTVLRDSIEWMPDSQRLLVQTVPAGRGRPPVAPDVPIGPKIQESSGKYSPTWTFQDLLTSRHDEDLFDYYMTSQLMLVDASSGKAMPFGQAGIYPSIDPSPDGRYVLFTKVRRPYSWLHPYSAFPREIGVLDASGKLAHQLFSLPLYEIGEPDHVATGPRQVSWRPDEPATLTWVEALDGGNPRNKVPHRDKLMSWKAPFSGQPSEWTRLEHRLQSFGFQGSDRGIDWGKGFALVRDYQRERRWVRTFLLNTTDAGASPKLLFSRSVADRYGDPGTPVEVTSSTGHRVLLQDGDNIYLNGQGATPQGARPFLDRYDIKTGELRRLFRSAEKGYERVLALLSADGSRWVAERESPAEPPNYLVHGAAGDTRVLTSFKDPTPQLRQIKKQLVTYKRDDGVNLSFTLYLPPGYKEGTRLPAVLWAYPREYVDAGTAGQFGGSTERFTTITGPSHLFFLLAGYAILDDASLPVVGPPETVNNTYIEQIVSGAKAAIDKAASLGVTDPGRVGVGGHSYGGFMTANLLAHSNLFRAGIARSGAYNRTLTPFGFQSERRTIWEAPDVYLRMSPFLAASKINEPVLLIHGEADNNSGTFPIQSDRMYQAIRGTGGTVRLVFLPHEAHGYAARESIEHTLAEMIAWFDKYVKNAGAGAPSGQ
ncbi:MAG: S9 family peptidase [Acidobacteria bacterium]|nr:S9 family peptidase [Acidobacteriota bacterium]